MAAYDEQDTEPDGCMAAPQLNSTPGITCDHPVTLYLRVPSCSNTLNHRRRLLEGQHQLLPPFHKICDFPIFDKPTYAIAPINALH